MKVDLRFLFGVAAATVLGLAGCPADDSGETAADGGSTEGVDTESPTTGQMTAASMTSSSMSGASASTTDGTSTTTMTTSVTDTTMTTTGVEPQPDGAQCMSNEECISEMCFLAGILGGICGQCLTGADCEWGCNLPNPLVDPPIGAMCNDGMLGQGCTDMTDCMSADHFCTLIIDVPGVLSASTCSECETSADCTDQVCNVSVDIMNISGQKTCVDEGTVADGDFCDLEGDGDLACMGFCGAADIMGLVQFGVCGPCDEETDEGCDMGQTCEPPTVDLDGTVMPSQCV